jgi:hypothetical protein
MLANFIRFPLVLEGMFEKKILHNLMVSNANRRIRDDVFPELLIRICMNRHSINC